MVEAGAQSTSAEAAADDLATTVHTDATTYHSRSRQRCSDSVSSSNLSSVPPPVASAAPSDDVSIDLPSLVRLFRHFLLDYSVSRSSRTSATTCVIQQTCVRLFCRDYHCGTLDNSHGEYCASYPPTIIVCEAHKPPQSSAASAALPHSKVNDTAQLSTLFKLSRFNRVHGRFVCPVLLVDSVNISRSSTLSVPAEALYNNVATRTKELIGTLYETMSASFPSFRSPSPPLPPSAIRVGGQRGVVMEEVGLMSAREADEELLRRLSTRYIVDLMVEHKKKKMGVTLTSSEKSEYQQPQPPQYQPTTSTSATTSTLSPPPPLSPPPYADFTITPIPYPGCEFFAMYHSNGRSAVGLVFDWSQSFVDSLLTLEGGGVELEGLELSGEGEDEDGIYEYDTHWACWMQQQQQQQQQGKQSRQQRRASRPQSIDAASVTSESTSAERTDSDQPFTSSLTDFLNGEDEDADGASGRVRQTSAARDEPKPPRWREYKDWSVITLTKNYLLLLLHIIASSTTDSVDTATGLSPSPSGLSLHCVSGWDRTPLFISLLRLSLWADGEAHASLSAAEMLYLTLAYDWMLFSHHLANRHDKQEDIMYACFDMLQYIVADKFSLHAVRRSKQQHQHTAANGLQGEASDETGLPLPVTITAPVPPVAVSSPTAAATMDDSYFSADGQRSSISVDAPSSFASSSPIPIPDPTSTTPSHSPPSTPDISMLPASPSPSIAASPLLSSGGSSVESDSSAMHRNGSWTLIDVLGHHSGKLDTNGSSGNENRSEKSSGAEAGGEGESPPSQPAMSELSRPADMTSSWTATWTPQHHQPDSSPTASTDDPVHNQSTAATKHVIDASLAIDTAVDVEEAMRRARRCQRLLELRSLFLQTYHAVLPVSPSSPAAAILNNHPICPHFQRAQRLVAQLPTAAASVDGGDGQLAGGVGREEEGVSMESLRPFDGGSASGKSGRMIPWLPF